MYLLWLIFFFFKAHVSDAKNASTLPSNSGTVILEWHDGLCTELHNLFMDFLSSSWWWKISYIPGDNCSSYIDLLVNTSNSKCICLKWMSWHRAMPLKNIYHQIIIIWPNENIGHHDTMWLTLPSAYWKPIWSPQSLSNKNSESSKFYSG